MALLDSKGRLFGKLSILDLGALVVIGLVLFGIFFYPGTSGSVAQVGVTTQPVEVDVIVRGLSVRSPEDLVQEFRDTQTTNIVIRNQPYGSVTVKSVEPLERRVIVPQPDGTVKGLSDPRPESEFSLDMLMTLTGNAQITDNGVVLGNSKLKIGTPVELEGFTYNFNGSVIEVRVLE
ncbi:DUF4330 domain-containing protein [Roseofilum sp. BLCC_M91]|uniref:DUF4330 domain-containing protein n=1 Tax=Roseofilum halophilum BLCC-M91 TaxID=3022259 RepID=A0ABT7BEL6_9CYAN|nr:DUF4330 domain-containing protein [Roseofilum halophilum]MDJ1177629.1 DUF4330 domain-containing protein [Roseofilum halophilum BLCC-M91]